jgi:hypothetical protein
MGNDFTWDWIDKGKIRQKVLILQGKVNRDILLPYCYTHN